MSTFAAAILDELMGRDRNSNPDEKRKELNWSDNETCKYYLCGFCPALLFQNTRADIGICSKIHEDELAKSYQGSSRYMKMGYEEDFLLYLQQITSDIDRKINRNISRLSYNASHAKEQAQKAQEDRINNLSEKINALVEKVEELGNMGEVDEAQSTMKIVDTLKSERTQQELAMSSVQPIIMVKEMEVCPVCGAFLVVGDAPQRIEEHLAGKLHMGYAKVRSSIITLKEKLSLCEELREKRRLERRTKEQADMPSSDLKLNAEGNGERSKNRSKDRSKNGSKDKERKRTRSRSRSRHRSQSRHKDNKNDRDHHSINGHDRERRDKDRDRDRGDKEPSNRDDRDKRDRERDREGRVRDDRGKRDREKDRDKERNHHEDRDKRDKQRDRDKERSGKDKDKDYDKEKDKNRDRKRDRDQEPKRDRDGRRSRSKSSKQDRHLNKR